MPWDDRELKERFRREDNRMVVDYILQVNPSAHSDLSLEMELSAEGLPNVGMYCPDAMHYAYEFLHTTENLIFSICIGLETLAFRLPGDERVEAAAHGASPLVELGPEWMKINPFDPRVKTKEMRVRMKHWCAAAYRHALQAG